MPATPGASARTAEDATALAVRRARAHAARGMLDAAEQAVLARSAMLRRPRSALDVLAPEDGRA